MRPKRRDREWRRFWSVRLDAARTGRRFVFFFFFFLAVCGWLFGVGCGGSDGGDGSGWWCDSGGEEVVVEYGAKETTHRTDKKRQVCTA